MAPRPRTRALVAWLAAAAFLAACPAAPTGTTKPPAKSPAPRKATPGSAAAKTPAPPGGTAPPPIIAAVTPPPMLGTARAAEAGWNAVDVTGRVRLLSNNGAGIISDNSGGIISDNSGGIISDNSGGVISNNSGSIISDNSGGLISDQGGNLVSDQGGAYKRFGLLQAAPPRALESRLADAWVEVLDAAGRVLAGPDGKPLGAPTDQQGNFKLAAPLPAENLILRVRLFNGGELQAFLVRGVTAQDVDTASTLGTTYVMREYVKGDPQILGRLPAAEAAELQRDVEGARALLASPPDYKPPAMADLAAGLRTQAPVVDGTLARIKAILLAGQADLGTGEAATDVSLSQPQAVGEDRDGRVYIGERLAGRVRRVEADGTLSVVLGTSGTETVGIERLRDLAVGADGTLVLTDAYFGFLVRRAPGGAIDRPVKAGSAGSTLFDASTRLASAVALGADGTLWAIVRLPLVGGGRMSQLHRVAPGGTDEIVPLPAGLPQTADCDGLAVAPDGTLLAGLRLASGAPDPALGLFARSAAGVWTKLAGGLVPSGVAAIPAGGAYVAEPAKHRVVKVFPDGKVEAVLGTGEAGYSGDGGPGTLAAIDGPQGLCVRKDGTLLVVDQLRNVVRALAPDGKVRTFAGAVAQAGDATRVALNGPEALAVHPRGILVTEPDPALIRLVAGGQVTTFAGTTPGLAGDGGQATAAQLAKPNGVAVDKLGRTWFSDMGNDRIRRIETDGSISTVAGGGTRRPDYGAPVPALEARMPAPRRIAFDAEGRPYWADSNLRQVFRLNGANVEVVAGKFVEAPPTGQAAGPDLDDVAAREAFFVTPLDVAFAPGGALLIADPGGNRIRRLRPDGKVDTLAGLPVATFLGRAVAEGMLALMPEGLPAATSQIWGVASVAVGPDGRVYYGELGTEPYATNPLYAPEIAKGLPRFGGRVRRIEADGTVKTLAGLNAPGGLLAGTGVDDGLRHPAALIFDAAGALVIADKTNNQLKRLPKGTF